MTEAWHESEFNNLQFVKSIKRAFLDDLYELLNNLEDDLKLDLEFGENGTISYKASHTAVKKYNLQVLKKKIKNWEKNIVEKK